MNFEFATAARIVFGAGKIRELPGSIAGFGRRALVITGSSLRRAEFVLDLVHAAGVTTFPWPMSGEPTVNLVRAATTQARKERCDFVIGCGGGSVIDTAKAVAALMTNPGDVFDYLEVIGRGQALSRPGAPFVAIPTTAGTGAEVTRNAVLGSPEHRVKASLRSPHLLAKLALVDPGLSHGVPPALTASTGLDALTQLIEPFVSRRANPMIDAFCREGIRRAAQSLPRVFDNGADTAAREEMALAALWGGLALANAGLGAVHGFAAPIGGMFPAPHGAVCAALLPHVMATNLRALRERDPESELLSRFDEVARCLTGQNSSTADDGIRWVEELCRALKIPSLRAFGISAHDHDAICGKAAQASSMKANPITLTPAELHEVLEKAT